jgi:hypothetical protein
VLEKLNVLPTKTNNGFGLVMSLNMLLEFDNAFDFTGPDFWEYVPRGGVQAL